MLPVGCRVDMCIRECKPARRSAAIFANHAVPAIAIEGWLDQRVGEIAQQLLIVRHWRSEILCAEIAAMVAADTIMHVIADQQWLHPAKITVRHTATEAALHLQAL